ncbi:MAG TPA: aspartyl protease family protein [Candidatus Eremiobacteraceae bacterium]
MVRPSAVAALVAVALSLSACDSVGQAYPLNKDVAIPFELANNHIFVKVNVDKSKPLWFVLDTGDKYAIINEQNAKDIGLDLGGGEVEVTGVGNQTSTAYYVKNSSYSIAGLDGFSQPIFLALPLEGVAAHTGHASAGIIGFDFLSKFIVEIDYDNKTLILHDRDQYQYHGNGEILPLTFGHGHPHIAAQITQEGRAPIDATFLLDVGDGGAVTLNSPFVTQEHLMDSSQKTALRTMGYGVGGGFKSPVGRIRQLEIGRFTIPNPVTAYSQATGGAFATNEVQGSIGADILRKFKVILDYAHNRVILEPGAHFADPLEYDMSGLALSANDVPEKTLNVDEVYPDSPASEAEIQGGDVITSIDGRPISQYTLSDVREMFRHETKHDLTFDRGGQTVNVTLKLRRLI